MKKFFLSLLALSLSSAAFALEREIKLSEPDLQRSGTMMQALADRQSTREFSTEALSLQDLSDLLWAADGINRPESGKRTAPSAMDRREVDIYAIFSEGAYLYNAQNHSLELVAEGDLRPHVAGRQETIKEAPLCLVLVSDDAKYQGRGGAHDIIMRSVDVGIVSQNISLFCAANHLATVPRGWMDEEALRDALHLTEKQILMLNHPVGYFK